MKELLPDLVESLREELKHYGEMLALLDHQKNFVIERRADDLLQNAAAIDGQSATIVAARSVREQYQLKFARHAGLSDNSTFAELIPLMPSQYRPLVQALVQENGELLLRVQQRARQNHLLLSRVADFMQRFIQSLPSADAVGLN